MDAAAYSCIELIAAPQSKNGATDADPVALFRTFTLDTGA
jgi:hypothetical protein